ncbi:hypothetical protein [Isoalcanivorax indicus]|uniref:hypothetical protein n=1 Tax=Isoalcanivorax indicus TaxID=2202653 RepID=UPI000DB98683|nr:hypothetical protein [Isoalcanivorax indicus]
MMRRGWGPACAVLLLALLGSVSGCSSRPDAPGAAAGEAVRLTYVREQQFDHDMIALVREQPERVVVEFPGQPVNLSTLPPDLARLLDLSAQHGSGIRLVAWDESVRERSLGMLEIKAAVEGARYLRSLYAMSQQEMQRRRERRLGDYDVDLLFDPHSGNLVYLRFERSAP